MRTRGRIALACACLAATLTAAAVAGPREDAVAAYQHGDYASAFQLWQALAEQGDASAQMALGFLYHDAQGVPRDYKRAYMWFYLAASNAAGDEQSFKDAMDARDLTAKEMTLDEVGEAHDTARRCQAQHYKGCN